MSSFPPWLDRATLEWAADYCELMGIRLADVENAPGSVGADVCARGLREAQEQAEARPQPLRPAPLLSLLDGAGNGSGDG